MECGGGVLFRSLTFDQQLQLLRTLPAGISDFYKWIHPTLPFFPMGDLVNFQLENSGFLEN